VRGDTNPPPLTRTLGRTGPSTTRPSCGCHVLRVGDGGSKEPRVEVEATLWTSRLAFDQSEQCPQGVSRPRAERSHLGPTRSRSGLPSRL